MKHRVLIVDDSVLARKSIRRLIEPLHVDLAEATNGREGMERIGEDSFDLVITDVDMPEMNGIELCEHLKEHADHRRIPVIIVSAFDSETEIERAFQAGASEYISKKEMRDQLVGAVSRILADSMFRKKRHILVVDDSVSIRKIVAVGLERAGYEVSQAENGRAALARIVERAPDLVLSDIQMPEMDGFALCAALHGDLRFASIPYVAMSTMDDRASINRILRSGAASYIVKPFNLDQLTVLLDRLLSDQFRLILKERERLDAERNTLLFSITSLVSALEARDAYTCGHSESVATISSALAALAGLPEDDVETIGLGGRLHDIGKIGVRDNVLLKQGQLTDDEYAHIQQHPVIGDRILSPITSLAAIIPIVRHHHERWDGTGYPDRLAGEAIPYLARLTSIADVYDALISDRPYRDGMPRDRAVAIIRAGRGTQFCSRCVDLFLDWIALPEDRKSTLGVALATLRDPLTGMILTTY